MKAAWATPFKKAATAPEPFTLASGEKADVPFMHRAGTMTAGRAGKGPSAVTLCVLPYAGGQLAMVVIVPDAVDGLAKVLAGLDGKSLAGWLHTGVLREQEVNLAVPKWKARRALALNDALASMGMKQAFESRVADFSGIDGTRELFVSAVVHEGFVDVGEEGTEAAAFTFALPEIGAAMHPPKPLEVRADRPFAWAVVHQGTGAVLFAGTVTDPR